MAHSLEHRSTLPHPSTYQAPTICPDCGQAYTAVGIGLPGVRYVLYHCCSQCLPIGRNDRSGDTNNEQIAEAIFLAPRR